MKLKDLIDALAGEIENVQPQLAINLDDLLTKEPDHSAFVEALDQYSEQVQRMGEAMELAGFPGLQGVCSHVLENTLLLATQVPAERHPAIGFLQRWPALMVNYLRNLEDPSAAAGLLDHMRAAPHPMDEETALKACISWVPCHCRSVYPQRMSVADGQLLPPPMMWRWKCQRTLTRN